MSPRAWAWSLAISLTTWAVIAVTILTIHGATA